uniref:EH domain-containing protein n=1 Tax=Amphiprion percula TaxID=161767 RepID=A0A3P8UE30_AMPPE
NREHLLWFNIFWIQEIPGKISAGDAAQFLKKSGLSDISKLCFLFIHFCLIWDLADSERKGCLDKRGFFIALRLVASAQGGNHISLNNLNQNFATPKFVSVKIAAINGH